MIEKQYEELKNGIKFRIENNITDDWEQHYHCIDVLCEKHKERIRDVEYGICAIEELKKKLAEKDKSFEWLHNKYAKHIEICNQDKILFCIEQLEKVKAVIEEREVLLQKLDEKIEETLSKQLEKTFEEKQKLLVTTQNESQNLSWWNKLFKKYS